MAKKVGTLSEDDIKDIRSEAVGLSNDLDSISKKISSALSNVSKTLGESTSAFKESFNASKSLADAISKVDAKTLASKKEQAKFQDKVRKAQEEATRLEAKANRLRAEAVNLSKTQALEAYKVARAYEDGADKLRDQARAAGKIVEEFEKLNNDTRFFDSLAEITSSIPVVGKVFGEFQKASDAARKASSEGGNALLAGANALVGALGKLALTLVVGKTVEMFKTIDERTVNFSRSLGIASKEAFELNNQMLQASLNSGLLYFNAERFTEAQNAANATLGSNVILSSELGENYSALVYRLGFTNDEATKFNLTSVALGKSAKEYTGQITAQTKLLNGERKLQIDNRQIMKDISETSSRIQISSRAQNYNLVEAAYNARALGMSMQQIEKTADHLLNFEASISSELEAELLTGKQINLEEARLYAFKNDMVGLTRELAKQNVTAYSFGKMNRIEQESYAEALGMSAEELSTSLKFQEQLSTLSKDSGYRDAKSLDDLKSRISIRAKEIGYDKALAEIGNQELKNQLDAATLQEQFQEKQTKAMEELAKTLGPEGLKASLDGLKSTIDSLILAIQILAGIQLAKGIWNMAAGAKNMLGSFTAMRGQSAAISSNIQKVTMANGRTAFRDASTGRFVSNAAGKSAMRGRMARGMGGGMGLSLAGMAADYGRENMDDPNSGAGKGLGVLGSTLTYAGTGAMIGSIIPGVGTLIGGAIGGLAGLGMGMYNEFGAPKVQLATGGIVTKPTRALIGEAGDEAVIPLNSREGKSMLGNGGGNNEMATMISILTQILNKDSSVYMDSTKVGTAMNIGSVKVS
jgi:hypothetical protein